MKVSMLRLLILEYIGDFQRKILASNFIYPVLETFVTRILLTGLGLFMTIIVARMLGPEGRGLYAVAAVINGIGIQLGNLGLHAANTYYGARDRALVPELTGNSLIVGLPITGLACLLMGLVFLAHPEMAPLQGLLLVIAFTTVPVNLTSFLLQNLLVGLNQIRLCNKIELSTKALTVSLIGLAALLGLLTVEKVLEIGLIAIVIGLVWSLWRLRQVMDKPACVSFPVLKSSLRYGLSVYLASFFNYLVLDSGLLIVEHKLGTAQAGFYSISVTMANLVYMLPVIVGLLLFAKVSTILDPQQRWRFTKRVIYATTRLMIIGVGLTTLLVGPAVRILFGAPYQMSIPAFLWLMPGIIFLSIENILQNYVSATGKTAWMIYAPLVGTVVSLLADFCLIDHLGISGAALASTLAYFSMFCISYWAADRALAAERQG
jgi:O-antigen/teichoic acid export membrane protein